MRRICSRHRGFCFRIALLSLDLQFSFDVDWCYDLTDMPRLRFIEWHLLPSTIYPKNTPEEIYNILRFLDRENPLLLTINGIMSWNERNADINGSRTLYGIANF